MSTIFCIPPRRVKLARRSRPAPPPRSSAGLPVHPLRRYGRRLHRTVRRGPGRRRLDVRHDAEPDQDRLRMSRFIASTTP